MWDAIFAYPDEHLTLCRELSAYALTSVNKRREINQRFPVTRQCFFIRPSSLDKRVTGGSGYPPLWI